MAADHAANAGTAVNPTFATRELSRARGRRGSRSSSARRGALHTTGGRMFCRLFLLRSMETKTISRGGAEARGACVPGAAGRGFRNRADKTRPMPRSSRPVSRQFLGRLRRPRNVPPRLRAPRIAPARASLRELRGSRHGVRFTSV
jgi:hypothetical protein